MCEERPAGRSPRQRGPAVDLRAWRCFLLIDDDYATVAPDLDVMAMIRETTPPMPAPGERLT